MMPPPRPDPRPAQRPHRASSAALVLLATLPPACAPYDPPRLLELQRLVDRAERPVDLAGAPLGNADATSIEDATRDLLAQGDAAPAAASDGPAAVSLDDLRVTVLRNNLDLRVVDFGPRIAGESLDAERAKFDAVFVAGASYLDADLPTGSSTLLGISSPDPALSGRSGVFTEPSQDREQFKADVGVDVPLPTGGRIGVREEVEIDDKQAGRLESTEDLSALSFSLSQPLLRGAGVAVNTASIRLAQLDTGIAAARARLTAIRVLADAEKAYWRLYAAQRTRDVRRQQRDLASENLTLLRRRIEAGDAPAVDRFAAELALAQQVEAVVIAETLVRLRARDLSRVLNRPDLPVGDPRELTLTSEPRLSRYVLDAEALAGRAEDERLDLLEIETQLAADAIRVDLARNAELPLFLVDFRFGLGERDGTIASGFAESLGFDHPSATIGARASIPVTNAAAEANARRAILSRAQRLATREQKRLAVRQEVFDAVDVVEQNWRRILAARQNVIAAAANYQAEQSLFTEGLRTAQDVLLALQQLGAAREKEVAVVAEYQSAQIDLAYATGVLLGYAGAEFIPSAPPASDPPDR